MCVVFNVFIYDLIFVAAKSFNVLFLETAGMQNDEQHKSLNQGSVSEQSMFFYRQIVVHSASFPNQLDTGQFQIKRVQLYQP